MVRHTLDGKWGPENAITSISLTHNPVKEICCGHCSHLPYSPPPWCGMVMKLFSAAITATAGLAGHPTACQLWDRKERICLGQRSCHSPLGLLLCWQYQRHHPFEHRLCWENATELADFSSSAPLLAVSDVFPACISCLDETDDFLG